MNALFSSLRTDWPTPWELFHTLDKRYGPFGLDVCATAANAKCARFFSPEDDGLARTWAGICWMNPPYGKQIVPWLQKAVAEVQQGHADRVVALLPARTDTIWWHTYVIPYGIVHFLKGRVRFEGAVHHAPFPSAVVIYDAQSTCGQGIAA